jgi:hypothetical protein
MGRFHFLEQHAQYFVRKRAGSARPVIVFDLSGAAEKGCFLVLENYMMIIIYMQEG